MLAKASWHTALSLIGSVERSIHPVDRDIASSWLQAQRPPKYDNDRCAVDDIRAQGARARRRRTRGTRLLNHQTRSDRPSTAAEFDRRRAAAKKAARLEALSECGTDSNGRAIKESAATRNQRLS